ncbi:CTP synthase 1 [Pocillopora verrucosa]|uniref:CTP synthase 1 n=1 Tax=Pocillopora verrucosa TaxID=203993 RepID=UPI002797329A|nr:CTP synthase 1-like [Pocillopora verrucosa]
MKYILVTGGVISGIGKGVISSSIGALLKGCGLHVTSIKIDPYLNIDAGTFSPYEHGEVFVLDDGGEVDLDLGNYERFLDVTLHRSNNITTGKIYQSVIDKERRGDYLGKTVQVVPHITDAIQDWVTKVSAEPVEKDIKADVCLIELGGTIGDIEGMPYIEAFRQFQFRVGRDNFCVVHVSLVPEPDSTGEQKTKPTQNSVRELRGLGLSPDLIMCRCKNTVTNSVKQKVSLFCHVPPEQVIDVHDCKSIYRVPVLLSNQGIVSFFSKRLQLEIKSRKPRHFLVQWRELAERDERLLDEVKIALVGKYTKLEDAYISVLKALKHASLHCNRRLQVVWVESENLEKEVQERDPVKYHEAWQRLCGCDGILVPGGFGKRGTEGKIAAAEWARKMKKPYLGVCYGLQLAVIEFARNILGLKDANSTENEPDTKNPVVIEMPEHNPGQLGGTMRLGRRRTVFSKVHESITRKLYKNAEFVEERHRHRYEVNPEYVSQFEEKGMKFVGRDVEGERMEIMEIKDHPYFVGVQYHPEYISRPIRPSPPYLGLILAAIGKLTPYIARGCRLSPRCSISEDEDEDEELANMAAEKLPDFNV